MQCALSYAAASRRNRPLCPRTYARASNNTQTHSRRLSWCAISCSLPLSNSQAHSTEASELASASLASGLSAAADPPQRPQPLAVRTASAAVAEAKAERMQFSPLNGDGNAAFFSLSPFVSPLASADHAHGHGRGHGDRTSSPLQLPGDADSPRMPGQLPSAEGPGGLIDAQGEQNGGVSALSPDERMWSLSGGSPLVDVLSHGRTLVTPQPLSSTLSASVAPAALPFSPPWLRSAVAPSLKSPIGPVGSASSDERSRDAPAEGEGSVLEPGRLTPSLSLTHSHSSDLDLGLNADDEAFLG